MHDLKTKEKRKILLLFYLQDTIYIKFLIFTYITNYINSQFDYNKLHV